MTGHAGSTDFDPFLGKESLAALARMGFGKREPRLGPHRFHGVGARTRLSVAGKRSMVTTSTHRHQHHKERVTINQVNDLAEIAREIDSFTKAGMRVPVAVWEKYDRVNKRHKKHEDMLALAAEARSKTNRKRRAREKQDQEQERQQGCDQHEGIDGPNREGGTNSSSRTRHQPVTKQNDTLQSPADNDNDRSSLPVSSQNRNIRRTAPAPFQGGRCTFGTGRGDEEVDALETLARRATHAPMVGSAGGPSSSWGQRERDKLNEIYWDLGRPPRRGAGAEREHFFRYTQRHCMVFPNRSPAEVIKRLKLMFRYNAMKEPNEREHWLKLNARRGFFPPEQASATTDTSDLNRAAAPAAATKSQQPLNFSALTAEPDEPVAASSSLRAPQEPTPAALEEEPLFRRSGGGGNGNASTGGLLSAAATAAASYAADAIKTASLPSSPSRPLRASLRAGGAVSPFYDPVRPNSPAWGFGEASPISPSRAGSRGGSRGDGSSRGGTADSRGGGGSRGVSGLAGGFPDDNDDDRPEETELLDYTSLGPQTISSRATSPAFAFSRGGLGSENLSMFQADKRPEPGPGSFQPNLSATSTHPGVRCGVVIGGRPGSRGGISSGDGGGSDGGGGSGGGMSGAGAASPTRPGPGPGHYSTWDAIGRQILSTRPSSPVVTFATGDWELR